MFYRLKPDIYARAGVLAEPGIPGFDDTFITGAPLVGKPPVPLLFRSNFEEESPPRGFEGMTIPLWSHDFVKLLRGAGVHNFDLYDAVIENESGRQWSDYHAANVIGIVAAADMSKSRATEILPTPGGVPFARFQSLVIDAKKAAAFDLFRLAESPSILIVSERVTRALAGNPRAGGWGMTAFPVEEA